MSDDREPTFIGLALGVLLPIALAASLVSVRDVVAPTNIALALVVVVVVAAVVGGRSPGALAAVTAALAFDLFHTRPYLSLSIDSQDDVETCVLLLAVGAGRRGVPRTAGRRRGPGRPGG